MDQTELSLDLEIRQTLFAWLMARTKENGGIFRRRELEQEFSFQGQRITLVGPRGIWIPSDMKLPISITTTHANPYNDGLDEAAILQYKYMNTDPENRENTALRYAYQMAVPLVYFHAIAVGIYQALWPIYIHQDNPENLMITAALHHTTQPPGTALSQIVNSEQEILRRYATRETRQRLHQSAFRELVISAYSRRCTICNLQHPELLDAAHITADADDEGKPIVTNGLSLCKIHHAAYDKNILGITPDYEIQIRADILHEVDGPMLKYGLQAMNKQKIILPTHKHDYPDRDRLADRYSRFAS